MANVLRLPTPSTEVVTPTSIPTPTGESTPPPLLVRRHEAARLCSVGIATWDRWSASGRNPRPLKIVGAVFWATEELAEWCRYGCPPRVRWDAIWAGINRRK